MKRRPKGSGSIEPTRDGKHRARFPFARGKREDIEGSPFATYEAAERALDATMAALQDADAVQGGVTLRKLGEKAMAHREKEGYRAADTDQNLWDLRVETWENAGIPASATTRGDVRSWLASMRNKKTGKPLAAQTRKNALNLLRAVYAFGIDNEIVRENPCDGVRVKDHGSSKAGSTFLTSTEAEALVNAATDPAIALAIGSGLRSGELRTLHWEDVHESHIVVRYGGIKDGKLMPPKSGRIRDVPILPLARRALDELRARGDESPIVLPSVERYYRARGQVFDRLDWKAWLKSAGLTRRVRPHDLRHTCATLLLTGAWGDPWTYEEVKEMLGHSSVKVTERYARATGTLAQKAAAAKVHKPAISPQPSSEIASQAREIMKRRGWDSNPRMTVLQTEHPPRDSRVAVDVAGLVRAYVEAVASGSPFAHARGLDLADAAWSLAPAVREVAS